MGPGTDVMAPRSVHFIHVMKTGGTSFLALVRERLGEQRCWPPEDSTWSGSYADVDRLRQLDDEERARIRFYAGHHPFVASWLSGADVTITVLRDPVDRAISLLRQWRRADPARADASLDEVWDDRWRRGMLMWEYQVRQFAKDLDDDLHHTEGLQIDDRRMAQALAHLEEVDVLGLQERYGEFEVAALDALGWEPVRFPRRRVSADHEPVSGWLRRQIERESPADQEFYRRAVELYERRGPRHRPPRRERPPTWAVGGGRSPTTYGRPSTANRAEGPDHRHGNHRTRAGDSSPVVPEQGARTGGGAPSSPLEGIDSSRRGG